MTAKYTVLGNTTLATASSSVTFSSIPGGYKDLVLIVSTKADVGGQQPYLRLNGDSGSNYGQVFMEGNGSSASSNTYAVTSLYLSYSLGISNDTEFNTMLINIMDYSATDKHKTVLTRAGIYEYGVNSMAGRWASTSAVTSLTFTGNGTSAAGSTFRLLGVN